jgi:DNA-binding NarL/FixJ family response regulator
MSSKSPSAIPNPAKRVFLVDDHPVFRNGLAELLRRESDLQICGESDTAEQAMRALVRLKADLVTVDLSLPGKGGLELIKDLRIHFPRLLILVVSMHAEHLYAERALHAGANGYVMKQAMPETLLKAIRHVLRGEVYVSETLSSTILTTFAGRRSGKAVSPVMQLSDREFEVFRMLGEGKPGQQIARQLCISPKTVDAHRARIREKLRLQTAPELAYYAFRWVSTNKEGNV